MIKQLKRCVFLNNVYKRVYSFESLLFAYELRKGKHKMFILSVVARQVCARSTYWGVGEGVDVYEERR